MSREELASAFDNLRDQILGVLYPAPAPTPEPTPEPPPPLNATLVAITPTVQGTGTITKNADGSSTFVLPPSAPAGTNPPGYREEWHWQSHVKEGQVAVYETDFTLERDYMLGTSPAFKDRIIFQFHENDAEPVGCLQAHADYLRWRRFNGTTRPIGMDKFAYGDYVPVPYGQKSTLRAETLWSKGDDGYLIVSLNGTPIYASSGPTLNPRGHDPYPKCGIYGQPTRITIHDIRQAVGPDAARLLPLT